MTATQNTTRAADSTDRMPALTAVRTAAQSIAAKPMATRIGGAARRFLNALMRSLATPHV